MGKNSPKIPEILTKKSKNRDVIHREWPTCAMEARNTSAELSRQNVKDLKKLLNGERFSEAEHFRVIGIAIAREMQVIRLMEANGATTDPVSESFWLDKEEG